jgi:heat-inducible transcriptional repressor
MLDDRLDDRKAEILRVVVEEYIDTAQPVGSSHVTRAANLAVSSATVRNEMAVLEREGFLVQPHTSAGRIPTDKGYRFFVDSLTRPAPLQPAKDEQVQEFFTRAHGELEQMLHDTSQLLSRLTDYAAVVVGPSHEVASVRLAQLVGLGHGVALLVVVLSNGVVEKRTLELERDTSEAHISAASIRLAEHLTGRTLHDGTLARPSGDVATDAIVAAALSSLAASHDEELDHVVVGGAARMASAFDALDTVRQVLVILEQQYVVVSLLSDILDRGMSVAIGTEHGQPSLADCSIVVAPYTVEGEAAGTIGVLGPTRMNYPQAMAAVAVVSKRLGAHLTDG